MSYIIKPNLLLDKSDLERVEAAKNQIVDFIVRKQLRIPFLNATIYSWAGTTLDKFFIFSVAKNQLFIDIDEREPRLGNNDYAPIATITNDNSNIFDPDIGINDVLKYLNWALKPTCKVEVDDFSVF